jgi:hypothetical protein
VDGNLADLRNRLQKLNKKNTEILSWGGRSVYLCFSQIAVLLVHFFKLQELRGFRTYDYTEYNDMYSVVFSKDSFIDLSAFAKSQNATVSLVMSVCLSVRIEQRGSH